LVTALMNQAAAALAGGLRWSALCSMPSLNLIPEIAFGKHSASSARRQKR
jgi:hypothetical protein